MSLHRVDPRFLPFVLLAAILLAPTAAADGEPPAPPEDLQGQTQPGGTYLLSWQPPASGGVDSYRVYENGELLAEVAGLSHQVVDDVLAAAYTVTAVNGAGESQHSSPAIRTPFNQGPACVVLFPLPPLIGPSACVAMVDEGIEWVKELVCRSPCRVWNSPQAGSLVDMGP